MKGADTLRPSAVVRLGLLLTILACAQDRGGPTAPKHSHDPAPLANVVPGEPDPVNCTGYPEPRIWLESQAWWNKSGIVMPGTPNKAPAVGEHIHVGLCWPVAPDGSEHRVTTANQRMRFDVRVITHQTQVATQLVRVSQEGSVKIKKSLVVGPGNAGPVWVPFDIDFSTWSTGRRELRWTVRIARPDRASGASEMFNSTGWQLCIRSCSPSYRPVGAGDPQDPTAPFTEARGYYSGHDYDNVQFLSKLPVEPVRGLWTVKVRQNSSGPGGIFIDPDMHNGNTGTVIKATGGSFRGDISIDTRTLSDGPHNLVIVGSDGKNGGVQVIRFTVNNRVQEPVPTP